MANNISTGQTRKLIGADNGGWDRQIIFDLGGTGVISSGQDGIQIPNLNTFNKNSILTYISNSGVKNGSFAYINGNAKTSFTENYNNEGHHAITFPDNNNQSESFSLDANCIDSANVYIGDIIIFENILSSEEILAVEKYLSKKWSIALK